MRSLDAVPIPFRRPSGWVPAAGALALVVATLVLAPMAARLARLPEVPETPFRVGPVQVRCDAPECALPPVPSVEDAVRARLARRQLGHPPPDPLAVLPSEWDWVTDRTERAKVARVLAEVERYGAAEAPRDRWGRYSMDGPWSEWLDVRTYRDVLDRRAAAHWSALVQRADEEHALRTRDAERAMAAYLSARHDALRLRAWDWLLIALAGVAVGGALVHRWRRYGPLVLDAHGVRGGGAKLLWEDLAEARWSADRVVLVRPDGAEVVFEGLALAADEVPGADALTRRLIGRRAAAEPRAEAHRAVVALIGRER